MKVAFLGAGNMGAGMIGCLLQAGHHVTAYNRSLEKLEPLARKGAIPAETPAEAAAGADVIFSMVSNDEASRAVWCGKHGVFSVGRTLGTMAIECSTLSHGWMTELSKVATQHGCEFLDCPVAGRPAAAAAGDLAVFAGGAPATLETVRPLLLTWAKSITHFGPIGSGLSFKLIYNILGAVQLAALGEAMAGCAAADIDLAAAAQAFSDGATGSPHVRSHAPAMARGDIIRPPTFTPVGRVKDLNYGIDLLTEVGTHPTLARAARDLFQRMIDAGGADFNDTEIFSFLRTQG